MAFNFDTVTNRVAWTTSSPTQFIQNSVSLPLDTVNQLAKDIGGKIAEYEPEFRTPLGNEPIRIFDALKEVTIAVYIYDKLKLHNLAQNEIMKHLVVGYGIGYGLDDEIAKRIFDAFDGVTKLFPPKPKDDFNFKFKPFMPLRKEDLGLTSFNPEGLFRDKGRDAQMIEGLKSFLKDPDFWNLLIQNPPKPGKK